MLPEPYKFIKNIGFQDYYYFKLEGLPYQYLAVSGVEEVSSIKKRRFRKDKIENHEIPMSLTLLPLNSLVLFFIYQASMIKSNTYEMDIDGNKIELYPEWDEFDFSDLKKVFREQVVAPAGTSNYELNYVVHNPVAKGFDRDGFTYIATEHVNMLNRSYWLMRSTQYGNLHIVEVKESGTKNKNLTIGVNEILLDRSLIDKIASDLDNGAFVKEEDFNVVEVESLDEMREGA